MHVAIRELKSSLSRIVDIPALDNEGLRRLMAKGTLTLNGSKSSFAPALELMLGAVDVKSMAQMVLEDRG